MNLLQHLYLLLAWAALWDRVKITPDFSACSFARTLRCASVTAPLPGDAPSLRLAPGQNPCTAKSEFIFAQSLCAQGADQGLARRGGGPVDDRGRPLIRKLGTIDLDMVETTPIVLNGKLWRFEWVRQGTGQQYWNNT